MIEKNLVSADWLNDHIGDEKVVVADCRFDLSNPDKGRNDYNEGHIPGATYFDLEKDLSGQVKKHGGRHPLPQIDEFAAKLSSAGIGETKYVVAYDDQGGAMAARLWWLLKYLGHDQVAVLEIGYSEWANQGYPTTIDEGTPEKAVFTPNIRPGMVVGMEEVSEKKESSNVALIDARAPERYRGEVEPMDKKAGHIPGAENLFWKENISSEGKWKSKSELQGRFDFLQNKEEIIAYCGSGVTASANVLALKEAGFGDQVKLYVGSWSDWSSYDENPVETEEKK
ncbi:sulfurtransferase [Halobacillus naozhouensis]|uniref:Sulfurtransferase n=1 Tax=Halobacillus naozhouensis TaxID=554880 RepID=A0ABY8J422_9BACI|nr:sulfurtransferase [Halobacillus naozhouensis]WFT76362.1 sulfurtransferase [Halobacillus naozhouensis]